MPQGNRLTDWGKGTAPHLYSRILSLPRSVARRPPAPKHVNRGNDPPQLQAQTHLYRPKAEAHKNPAHLPANDVSQFGAGLDQCAGRRARDDTGEHKPQCDDTGDGQEESDGDGEMWKAQGHDCSDGK